MRKCERSESIHERESEKQTTVAGEEIVDGRWMEKVRDHALPRREVMEGASDRSGGIREKAIIIKQQQTQKTT
jgi:hypothetical protein